jgi:KDO2-lipid IV(A) lauroyltransferase
MSLFFANGIISFSCYDSSMMINKLSFIFILAITWPIRYLRYSSIHRLGAFLGTCIYYLIPKFRKRTLSNLALASSLQLTEEQMKKLAKSSLQNLIITCLEYAKLSSEKEIHRVATCVNPELAARFMKENKPVIFFCGHQSNWEVLFLEGTRRMPGVAIGRPIENVDLYNWILTIRQKYGGKIIAPQNAIREGLKGLKKGAFLGIVGDQGMPNSGYYSPFFGRKAWTSPLPAILSHRTGLPMMVASTRRKNGKYYLHYSDPIWPNPEAPLEQEIDRLMNIALAYLEATIKEEPGQWLWSHNRWKQQTPEKIKKKFRHESILIILPSEEQILKPLLSSLSTFREIYPYEFVTIYAPRSFAQEVLLEEAEIISYSQESDLLKRDYRFKLVFNLSSSNQVKPHFKKLAAFQVISLDELYKEADVAKETPLDETLKKAILRHAS